MGRFSVRTASLVLLYKGSPTCPVTASRVSCLLSNLPLSRPLLPVVETVPLLRLVTLPRRHLHSIPNSIMLDYCVNSRFSLRAHCIGGDIRLYLSPPMQ
jgi:hypothetical protein